MDLTASPDLCSSVRVQPQLLEAVLSATPTARRAKGRRALASLGGALSRG